MDHLKAIRAFARVVETGGFGRAAQSLQMPNATLSKAIKSLEGHLGVQLLERSTRRVSVTHDGQAYYERTRHLLTELDDIESTLGQAKASPRGRLRVDTGGAVASALLIPALPDFCARYPDIQLQLGVTDRTVDVIGENVDCAIRSTANDGALIARKIGSLAWTTCASPAYLTRYGTPTEPRQLESGRFPVAGYFSAHSGALSALQFCHQGQPLEITPHCHLTVNESNAHLATALAGLGLIHTLDFMVRPAITQGQLVPVLESWRPAPLDVYINYAPSRQLSTKVRVFAQWVTALFAKHGEPNKKAG
ncbi:MAG: LysR substrate-binding domain-containing protein [Pseudomonadota bacterium]|uniref:LysR family transcriptional regulator n=1 Tax=Gallaecimonas pentaromativorans TaxID=584787 RepID=UPI00067EFAAE|nr:LysR family transcriptional regulator [Gallaecimonas pentaromativorans]MED5526000.1 LysR substrate-binding domain-containing protein [Pseudomonadota bacterium]